MGTPWVERQSLLRKGWIEPGSTFDDGTSLVGTCIFAKGYGVGTVITFQKSKLGASSHTVQLEDGKGAQQFYLVLSASIRIATLQVLSRLVYKSCLVLSRLVCLHVPRAPNLRLVTPQSPFLLVHSHGERGSCCKHRVSCCKTKDRKTKDRKVVRQSTVSTLRQSTLSCKPQGVLL